MRRILQMSRDVQDKVFLVAAPFAPIALLAIYWVAGEAALFLSAGTLSALLLAGWFVKAGTEIAGRVGGRDDAACRRQAERQLGAILRQQADTGLTSSAIVLALDETDRLAVQFGADATDRLLHRVHERLRSAARDSDMVVRLGPTRFCLVLGPVRRADLETLIQISARLQADLAEPFAIDAVRVFLSASAGFCLPSRAPERDGKALIDAAGRAADEAQAAGPGSIRSYTPGMRKRDTERRILDVTIRDALHNGQISAWFLPQVAAETGDLAALETVPRWDHAERGELPAADFVPLVAEQGLCERLFEITLTGALSALRDWDESGCPVPRVVVGLNGATLDIPSIHDKLKWELDRFGISPGRLNVQVREATIATTGNDVALENLAAIARLGCPIDLGEFGRGHTSLANLRRFSIARIKIDRSFIARVDRDREQQNMVRAVLTMAGQLSVATIAEGVETSAEHARLALLGCGYVQGHAISRPMRADAVAAWLAERQVGPNAAQSLAGPDIA